MMSKSADKIYKNNVADAYEPLAIVDVTPLPFAHLPANNEFVHRLDEELRKEPLRLSSIIDRILPRL